MHKVEFTFNIDRQDIGKELEVNTISIELGDRSKRSVVLYWKGDCKNALRFEPENYSSRELYNVKENLTKQQIKENESWNQLKILNKTLFIHRPANIDIKLEHSQPVLVNEFYVIHVKILNKEKFQISNFNLTVSFLEDSQSKFLLNQH